MILKNECLKCLKMSLCFLLKFCAAVCEYFGKKFHCGEISPFPNNFHICENLFNFVEKRHVAIRGILPHFLSNFFIFSFSIFTKCETLTKFVKVYSILFKSGIVRSKGILRPLWHIFQTSSSYFLKFSSSKGSSDHRFSCR